MLKSAGTTVLMVCAVTVLLAVSGAALAQDAPPPEVVDHEIQYSPYPGQDFPNQVFGDD